MSGRRYFCFCESNCRFETMTKEQILAAIAQAAEHGLVVDPDAGFVTKVKESNAGGYVTFWVGTTAQYNALDSHDPNCIYVKTDDDEGAAIAARLQQYVDDRTIIATDPNNDGNVVLAYGGKVEGGGSSGGLTAEEVQTMIDATLGGIENGSY